jgi:hypothetical protein
VKADGTGPAAFITPGGHVRNNSMKKISVEKIQIELEKILTKKRREAILFALLTVLLTPFLLVLFLLALFAVIIYVDLPFIDHQLYSYSLYTGLNGFLAFMFTVVLFSSKATYLKPKSENKYIITAAGLYAALLFLTYGTHLKITNAVFFGLVYALFGIAILLLFGQIYAPKDSYYLGVFHGLVDWPFSLGDDINRAHFMVPVAFTIPKLILMSYGEIINSSWLWRPPEWFEINAASEIMYGLASNDEERAMRGAAAGRALSFLGRLKLVRIGKARLSLGVGGRRFIGKL